MKQSSKTSEDPLNKTVSNTDDIEKEKDFQTTNITGVKPDKEKADMGTQWECDKLLNEWEPNVPALSLPKEDSVKETATENERLDKSKRLNLFALSDEMPSSLRGGITNVPENIPIKSSLTLVSEYLQNRNLKLRQPEPYKKTSDDLQSIKQTIQHTRSSRIDGSIIDNVCHVLNEQVMPVPSWHAESSSGPFYNNMYTDCAHNNFKLALNNICTSKISNSNIEKDKHFKNICSIKKNCKCSIHRQKGDKIIIGVEF